MQAQAIKEVINSKSLNRPGMFAKPLSTIVRVTYGWNLHLYLSNVLHYIKNGFL